MEQTYNLSLAWKKMGIFENNDDNDKNQFCLIFHGYFTHSFILLHLLFLGAIKMLPSLV